MSDISEKNDFTPSPEYLARQKRIDDAMNLRKPDRVPVVPINYLYYPTRQKGISNREAMYDLDKTYRVWAESVRAYDWDAAPPTFPMHSARLLEIMGIKQMKWPGGGGLNDDQPFQWVEGEYMSQSEYDEALNDPAGFTVRKLWPRVASFFDPIGPLANMPAPLLFALANPYALPGFFGQICSSPPVVDFLQKARQLGEAHNQVEEARARYATEMRNHGYPIIVGPGAVTAFDAVSDMLRGMKGSMLDMYKSPDKLLALVDMFIPFTIAGAVMQAKQMGIKGVFIALHRGAGGFMSDKQFAKFYWPGLKALLMGLIDAGLTPMPFMEGNYTPRLEYLQDLPAKKILPHWDIVDRKKVKEMLGDSMCFWGNVPASLLCTGTPQRIKDDVKELIDIFGDNGGLIVSGIPGIPDEAKPENVQAMADAVRELS